jgi:hypothetical protein|tara:strand:- start:167 stop:331 length:165 start_codon:yes stop_codon:yes gene_type:complete
VRTSIEPIEAAIAILCVIKYEIKIVSHEANILHETDLPIDLDFLSLTTPPKKKL